MLQMNSALVAAVDPSIPAVQSSEPSSEPTLITPVRTFLLPRPVKLGRGDEAEVVSCDSSLPALTYRGPRYGFIPVGDSFFCILEGARTVDRVPVRMHLRAMGSVLRFQCCNDAILPIIS